MSRPIKNAFGKDITPDNREHIERIKRMLEELQERKSRCDELADVRRLKLQQLLQLRTCERDCDQVRAGLFPCISFSSRLQVLAFSALNIPTYFNLLIVPSLSWRQDLCSSWLFMIVSFYVFWLQSNLLGDQKLVAVKDISRWPFRTDCFNRECAAEGQKQSGRITQMTIKDRWLLGQIWMTVVVCVCVCEFIQKYCFTFRP
jgi:hypothetical protein